MFDKFFGHTFNTFNEDKVVYMDEWSLDVGPALAPVKRRLTNILIIWIFRFWQKTTLYRTTFYSFWQTGSTSGHDRMFKIYSFNSTYSNWSESMWNLRFLNVFENPEVLPVMTGNWKYDQKICRTRIIGKDILIGHYMALIGKY